jgi:hypothetical protein
MIANHAISITRRRGPRGRSAVLCVVRDIWLGTCKVWCSLPRQETSWPKLVAVVVVVQEVGTSINASAASRGSA